VLILGLSGGQCLTQDVTAVPFTWLHDAAAVLIEDGRIVAGIEEERLNRVKHTNRAPLSASRFCLETRGISGRDLDHVAVYWDDSTLDGHARMAFLRHPDQPVLRSTRDGLRELCATHLDIDLPSERVHFVRHHLAHAVSAFALSGFERSLVVTLDAQGDHEAGLIAVGREGHAIAPRAAIAIADSLGYLYQEAIMFLGYQVFDEYKVMGLAPYGDPARYHDAFNRLYTLLPDGGWRLHRSELRSLYSVLTPRRKSEAFTQAHKDFAAGLQATLETIVFHLLRHLRTASGERHLCLAGGVAHNCTLNGKIHASGLFDQVFVQPAAHDAGAALGAALQVYLANGNATPASPSAHGTAAAGIPRLEHLYWGRDIGSDRRIEQTLDDWHDFLEFEPADDICARAAALMASGHVIGWAQGRSEFGPRALGNRSIVADPRPAENKTRINAMVKKREAYRPFAPSVLVEDAADYFVLPKGVTELPHMIVVVDVREDKRALLGAVTHVDGSARVQTVSRNTNEKYWRLIDAFKQITGVPVVLNTSFNNHVEPIVDSVEDAVVCFLTTDLHHLAIGNWLVRKRDVPLVAHERLIVSLPPYVRLTKTKALDADRQWQRRHRLEHSHQARYTVEVSRPMYDLLDAADGCLTVREICAGLALRREEICHLLAELRDLWSLRAVVLQPSRSR
jgi:carbamoyltransferase